jgi:uncharacterized membrane protein
MRYARALFIFVLLACVLETVRLWFLSPDVMAAHFNIQGSPNRIVSKLEFFGFEAQILLVVIAASILIQVLPMILPVQWINIRHREYWLSPERRTNTVDRLSSFGATLSTIILLVIQAGFELAVSANLEKPILFGAQIMVAFIPGFIFLSFVMLFWLGRSFRLPS